MGLSAGGVAGSAGGGGWPPTPGLTGVHPSGVLAPQDHYVFNDLTPKAIADIVDVMKVRRQIRCGCGSPAAVAAIRARPPGASCLITLPLSQALGLHGPSGQICR